MSWWKSLVAETIRSLCNPKGLQAQHTFQSTKTITDELTQMKPILVIYKTSKEFKGILREQKKCGGKKFNKQTDK